MLLFLTHPAQSKLKQKSVHFLSFGVERVTQKVKINDPNIFSSCENMPYGLNPLFSNLYKLQPWTFMTFVCIPSHFWPYILQLWAPSQRAEPLLQLKAHLTQCSASKALRRQKGKGRHLSAPKQLSWAELDNCCTYNGPHTVIVHFLFTIRN